jgi:MFS transporter, DHA1 family, tetracycline resistance protein
MTPLNSLRIQSREQHAPTQRALAVIFFIMLLDVIGVSILYPVAAFVVKRYSDEALMVTLLTVIYAAAQFFAAPVLGKLGDRYGRRPVLLVSVFGSAVGYVIFGIGGALWVLFLSRLIDGISAGNMSTCSAYIADVSKPEERAKNFALVGVAWGVGLVVGPAIGAALGQFSLEAPAFLSAGLSVLTVVLAFFLLPESLPPERREAAPIRLDDLNPFASISAMARKAGLGRLLLALSLFTFTFNGINSTQSLFMIDKFAAQPWQVGLLLAILGITVAAMAAIVRPLVKRFGEQPIAITGLLGQALGNLLIFFAPALWLLYPLNVMTSALSGFIFPTLGTLSTNRVPEREIGLLMGVTTALGSLTTILGPLWAGVVYDGVMVGAPYWMGGFIFVLAALVLGIQRHSSTSLAK